VIEPVVHSRTVGDHRRIVRIGASQISLAQASGDLIPR
jgi:hypothetical protein